MLVGTKKAYKAQLKEDDNDNKFERPITQNIGISGISF